MNQSIREQKTPLYLRSSSEEIPVRKFEGDLYQREALAKRLTDTLARFPDGAVLSIDAPWDEGKTWFGRNWQASLNDLGFRTAYIDCFQRDHIDDPFAMLAGEFVQLAKLGKSKVQTTLIEASKKVAASLLPVAAKFAANAAGHWLIGNADLGKDIAKTVEAVSGSAADKLEKLVTKSLEDYEAEKRSVEGFRKSLGDLAAESEKPIVIFVDELDRCRPDFAVRTIERIKHFFGVPGIVFVLLINRKQLVAAVRGLYGQDVEADLYLGKFIQLSLTLPKRVSGEFGKPDDNRTHCEATLIRFGIPQTEGSRQFAQSMGLLASLLKLSLRDIERAVVLYSFSQPVNASSLFIAWPIAIKLYNPALFARLILNDQDAHAEAYKWAAQLRLKFPVGMENIIRLLEEMHNSGSQGFTKPIPEELMEILNPMTRAYGINRFFSSLFERVDLSVST